MTEKRLCFRSFPGLSVILFAAFLIFMVSGAARAATGVIGAMDEEISFIKKSMSVKGTSTVAGRVFYSGKLQGQDIVLVKSEIGKVNAAMTAQILIRDFKVTRVIFTGVAGGLDPALRPGDIVISTKLVEHDFGMLSGNVFTPWQLDVPRKGAAAVKYAEFTADPALVDAAWAAAQGAALDEINLKPGGADRRKPVVVKGGIATGDQFIASTKKREWLNRQFGASAVEMEGAAVAQVCVTYNVPFVVIRSLSDLADDVSHNTFMLMKDAAAHNSAILVSGMLMELGKKKKR